jgi:uncharacterized protein YjbI with pentapeptide repeats
LRAVANLQGRCPQRGFQFDWVQFGATVLLDLGSIQSADLFEANLSEAFFSGELLDDGKIVVRKADLSGADLGGAKGLTQSQVDAANGDRHTRLPKNLHRPQSWQK